MDKYGIWGESISSCMRNNSPSERPVSWISLRCLYIIRESLRRIVMIYDRYRENEI